MILFIEVLMFMLISFILNKGILISLVAVILINLVVIVGWFLIKRDNLLLISTIFSSLIVLFFTENLGMSSLVKLSVDYLIFLMFIKLIYYFYKREVKLNKIYILFFAVFIISFISVILNNINPLKYSYYLYFDYFRYFIICAFVINCKISNYDIKKYAKYLLIFLIIQIPIILFQNYYGIKNGLFNTAGGNAYQDFLCGLLGGKSTTELGLYICIMLSALYILYQMKKINATSFIIAFIACLIVLVISEIKFTFALVLLSLTILTLIEKVNKKSLLILFGAGLAIVVSFLILGIIYPWFKEFLNISKILEYINAEYAGSGLSRANSFIVAFNEIKDNFVHLFLGEGISSAYNFKEVVGSNSFIPGQYIFIMFSVAQYIFELGILGVITLYSVFFIAFHSSIKLIKDKYDFNKIVGKLGIVSIVLFIISHFYGLSMEKVNFAVFAWCLIGLIFRISNTKMPSRFKEGI